MNKDTAQLLERHFDTAFVAPDGIAKLRELILTLAMQGKLVKQDPKDPPASKLLKEIETEKQRLVKANIFRNNDDKLSNESTCSFELPMGWEWASIQQLGFVLGGKRLPKGHAYSEFSTDYRYLTVTNMKNGTVVDNDIKYITQETHEEIKKYVISKDDIYITIAGTIGAVGIIPEHCDGMNLTENASRLVFWGCDKFFLVHLLNSGIVQEQFDALTNKMAQPKLSLRSILSTGIPIPPLPEQHRIVARIDQLMARCDELEKLRTEREQQRLAVHTAAIQQLLDEPDGTAWNFIQQHFGELYTIKENVAELRKAILQLAVMGRLVPQDPNDPPAKELLEEIEAEKQRLVKAKKIKKPKPILPISEEEWPFPIPQNWLWVRINELAESIDYGTSQKTCDDSSLVPVYRMGNIVDGQLVEDGLKYISSNIEELPRLYLKTNDMLFNRTNSYELVGKSALYLGPNGRATFASYLIRIRLFDALSNPKFLSFAMNAPYFRATQLEPEIVQQCGQANFNGTKLSLCAIPLPPLSEQRRIVARIDQLMALCNTLEHQIDATTVKQTELLNAVMAQV